MTAHDVFEAPRGTETASRVHTRRPPGTESLHGPRPSPGGVFPRSGHGRRNGDRPARAPLELRAARALAVATLAGLGALMLVAHSYYEAPIAERVRNPWHAWLKPSGPVGQGLGIGALALFLFLWLYPLRKKLGRTLERLGPVPRWLDVHIVAGLLVPIVAAVHAGWRFHGLIGLGYLSMAVVCASGIVGRYLYVHIPRGRNGVEMTMEEVGAERRSLVDAIARESGIPAVEIERRLLVGGGSSSSGNPLAVVVRMVRDDLARRRAASSFGRGLGLHPAVARAAVRLARREMALAQQARMLDGIQTLFRYWHAAHRPFALTALVAVGFHVAVAIAMGQTWFH